MVDIHGAEYGLGGDLSEDEITVIRGALDLSNKTALTCMTPLDKVPHADLRHWFLRVQTEVVNVQDMGADLEMSLLASSGGQLEAVWSQIREPAVRQASWLSLWERRCTC